MWDIGADRQIATVELEDLGLNGFLYTSIEFSPDGKFVDSVTDLGAIRLSVPALTMVSQVGVRRSQCNVAHLPDSNVLVSMDGPGRVSLLDMTGGAPNRTRVSRDSTSTCGVGVSPDGSIVAVHQPFTQRVALFDTATMRPIGLPIPVGTGVGWLAPTFSDPTTMVDVHAADGLGVFDLRPDAWESIVCRQVGRNLTAAEWEEYLGADEPYRTTCPDWPAGN